MKLTFAGHRASHWKSQDLNPRNWTIESTFLTMSQVGVQAWTFFYIFYSFLNFFSS